MKVLILAGGLGTRLSEETAILPKPMIEIGQMPIIWHIMKIYSHYGFHEFVLLLGYKGYLIKEYFANYFLHRSDVTMELATNHVEVHSNMCEPWKVTLIDTGRDSMTGGRVLRARQFVQGATFLLTYSDGVADIDINALLDYHRSHGGMLTLTTVEPESKYGSITCRPDGRVLQFREKPEGQGAWINGGFMVCESRLFDYLTDGDATILERAPLERLAREGQLFAYCHTGFWKCMDTLREKNQLQTMWDSGKAPWKVWT
jgi:glucose-1-phosphate cytidylyltransferase